MDAKRIEGLFKSYPTVDIFHVTKDGQAFEQKHHADSHAISLDKENPKVQAIKRGEKIEAEKEAPVKATGEAGK
jgi:hypothetical protein